MEIIEVKDGITTTTTCYKKSISSSSSFSVWLLPQNWEGDIQISNPSYRQKVRNNSNLIISLDIADKTLLYITNKANELSMVFTYNAIDEKTGFPVRSWAPRKIGVYVKTAKKPLPTSKDKKTTISGNYGAILHRTYGNFILYMYIVPKNKHEEVFAKGRLTVEKTVSNVLELPITVIRDIDLEPKERETFIKEELSEEKFFEEEISKEKFHLHLIIVESKIEAESIYQQLEKGASFIEIAKEKSIGPNRENGGDLGEISLSDLRTEMQAVIKNIKQGQFTNVFQLDSKYAILYLEEIKKPINKK